MGIAGGALASVFPNVTQETFQKLEDYSARQFMLIFIAPIIFAEGYGMKSHQFFENISRILCHAFLGTLISTLVVGALVFLLVPLTGGVPADTGALTLPECLAFGAMISSTDPVTTLAIFKEMHMVENGLSHLYYSVLGESILNDAVAITLFSSFGDIVRDGGSSINAPTSLKIFWTFCTSFVGSLAVGVAGGVVTALVLKFGRLGSGSSEEEHFFFNVPELGVALAMAYVPFLAAEALGLSGIVAVMFAGITQRRYAHYNLTDVTRQVFLPTIELFATLCETYVFVVLGLGVFLLSNSYNASVICWSLVACLAGRAVQVYPLSWVMNRCSAGTRLSGREQHVVWFAGLRGAVAFMCALGFPENETVKHRNLFLCTTMVIVGVTLVFLGWPTSSVIRCLDIKGPDDSEIPVDERGGARRGSLPGQQGPCGLCSCWSRLLEEPLQRASRLARQLLMTPDAMAHREAGEAAEPRVSVAGGATRAPEDLIAEGAALHRAALLSGALASPQLSAMGGGFGLAHGGGTLAASSSALGAGRPSLGSASASRPSLGSSGRLSPPLCFVMPQVRMSEPPWSAAPVGAAGAPDEAAGLGHNRRTTLPPSHRLMGPSSHISTRSTRMLCDP
mmetsp:Transcript_2704/g.7700  ORF Transcript_2704/g.7700 Transcript_2704/m.7700 type:complete len:621 (-) Transcript_2704:74-1936(-)